MMSARSFIVATSLGPVVLMAVLAGCGGGRPGSGGGKLQISAAASLREVVVKTARSFEADHPGVRLQLNFGASGSLRQQIEKGAPVDVFISASTEHIDRLVQAGRAKPQNRRIFARNRLVLIGAPDKLRSLGDLRSERVERVSIGDPRSVPAGKYARQWLEAEDVWGAIQGKTVLAGNVRQVLDYVRRGEVDAGVVYATDAMLLGLEPILAASEPNAPEVVYEAVLLGSHQDDDPARRFFDSLGSQEVRRVLGVSGFTAP